ncbi:hypothetical protein ACIRNI_09570 [Streptomyces sp. NPDC093546]|uniref:hypothetical protein n=1 Tax=Streptomyces sp. NPDC093546 TaxID=3366040 RepID=UPI0037FF5C0B
MRSALRTALATTVLAGVALTPVVTAGAAFAADGTAPAPAADTKTGDTKTGDTKTGDTKTGDREHVRTEKLVGGLVAEVYKNGAGRFIVDFFEGGELRGSLTSGDKVVRGRFGSVGVELSPDGHLMTYLTTPGAQGELIKTHVLPKEMVAHVYRVGAEVYAAEILKGADLTGALKAGTADSLMPQDKKVFDGVEVTLKADGTLTWRRLDEGGKGEDGKDDEGKGDAAKGTFVRDETLSDGTLVKIYKVAAAHHRAESFVKGHSIGVIDANARSAAGNNNGSFLVLNPDGTTHHWVGNLTTGGKLGQYKLADGTVLELGKKDGAYGLQLVENGKGRGFTYTNGEARRVFFHGASVVVLEQDGGIAAYHLEGDKQGAPVFVGKGSTTGGATPQGGTTGTASTRQTTATTQTTIVPKGGVAAGAEVEEGDHLLVVAGAGAAAVTAAGLGFVAMRRRVGAGTRA